jgi:hypothetical protein
VYPDTFAIDRTFKSNYEYPKYQLNGRAVKQKIEKIKVFVLLDLQCHNFITQKDTTKIIFRG